MKYFAAEKCPKHLHCKAIFSLEKRKVWTEEAPWEAPVAKSIWSEKCAE
jgi:hypothetical protein